MAESSDEGSGKSAKMQRAEMPTTEVKEQSHKPSYRAEQKVVEWSQLIHQDVWTAPIR